MWTTLVLMLAILFALVGGYLFAAATALAFRGLKPERRTRFIASYQPDIELRKRDYQAIFDDYCKQYAAFDKTSFRRHVNWYVNAHHHSARERRWESNTNLASRATVHGVVRRTHCE